MYRTGGRAALMRTNIWVVFAVLLGALGRHSALAISEGNETPSAPMTRVPRRVNGERRAAATEEKGPSEKSSSKGNPPYALPMVHGVTARAEGVVIEVSPWRSIPNIHSVSA